MLEFFFCVVLNFLSTTLNTVAVIYVLFLCVCVVSFFVLFVCREGARRILLCCRALEWTVFSSVLCFFVEVKVMVVPQINRNRTRN